MSTVPAAPNPPAAEFPPVAPPSDRAFTLNAERLRTWGWKSILTLLDQGFFSDPGFWSMVDQGAVSAGNFLTAVLLARALVPSEFGIYALIFALMLFMVSLHAAVIVYGLSLEGAAGSEDSLRPLVGGAMVLTVGLGTVLGAATGLVAVFLHRMVLVPWILLAVLFWQLQETTRRALLSRLRHRDAVLGDALSYLGQAVIVAMLFVQHRLSVAAAIQVMAMTSAVAWLYQVFQLKLSAQDFRGAIRMLPRFWNAGRWMLLTNMAQAFIDQTLLWFLALRGMTEVASFQSVLNLVRVTNPVMFAIGSVLLPTVAARQGDSTAGLLATRRYGLLGGIFLVPYLGAIFIFPGPALRLLYGAHSSYLGLGMEARLIAIASAFIYVTYVFGAYFNGLSKSHLVFRSQLIAAAAAILGCFLLVTQIGVTGAALTYVFSFAAGTVAYVWVLRVLGFSSTAGEVRADSAPQVGQP